MVPMVGFGDPDGVLLITFVPVLLFTFSPPDKISFSRELQLVIKINDPGQSMQCNMTTILLPCPTK